jgi:hypothetical protein
VLRARQGQPFTSASEELVDIAVIAAAIRQFGAEGQVHASSATAAENRPSAHRRPSTWKTRARVEGLRE